MKGKKEFAGFKYNIPSDISSSAFFYSINNIVPKSKLIIKNVNINPTRIGIITILKKMGVKIKFKNKKFIWEKKLLIY